MATTATTPRTRKTKASIVTESAAPLTEPKKRGRPRKNSLTPTIHKRSNSTDSKPVAERKSKKGDIPTIPQPTAADESKKTPATEGKRRTTAGKAKAAKDNIPQPADKFQAQKPAPKAEDHGTMISAADPEHVGTRVQAIGKDVTEEAQKFAEEAVEAIQTGGPSSTEKLQDLLESTLSNASARGEKEGGNQDGQRYKYEYKEKEIPQGEKTALLSFLGLSGLWVAFGDRLQKKKKVSH